MMGEEYGGPSYIGASSNIAFQARSVATLVVDLVPFTEGSPLQWTPRRFALKTSGPCSLRQGGTSNITLDAGSFVLENNVYWPLDVPTPDKRFLAIAGDTAAGALRVTIISDVISEFDATDEVIPA